MLMGALVLVIAIGYLPLAAGYWKLRYIVNAISHLGQNPCVVMIISVKPVKQEPF
jgi:hypothetical protein